MRLKCLLLTAFVITTTIIVIQTVITVKNLRITYNPQNTLKTESNNIRPIIELLNPASSTSFENNQVENIPKSYLTEPDTKTKKFNSTCAIYPSLYDIKFTNDHWQTQNTTNGTFQILSAYLDRRLSGINVTLVRIITMMDRLGLNQTYYCQLWYGNSSKPDFVATVAINKPWIDSWGPKQTMYFPYILACPLIDENKIPESVSLVENPCQNATNNVRIDFRHFVKKKNFVVCVKGLNFPFTDNSVRLIEWIEALFLLGADKINLYQFHVHPTVQRVLNYYNQQSRVEVTPLSLVGPYSNNPHIQDLFLHKKWTERRLQETIPYNDCLYKHIHQYKYVVLLDTDEVIVPAQGKWNDIIPVMQAKFPNLKLSSMMARNVYFMDNTGHDHDWYEDIPKYMHMLQHIYRSKNYTNPGAFVKGFHNTDYVVALHNHFALACLGTCTSREIDVNVAHLQHYRSDCASGIKKENCKDFKTNNVMDSRIWNYKDDLIRNVQLVLEDLDIKP